MILENLTANGSSYDNASGAAECGVDQMKQDYNIGDTTWVKIRKNSWWPAQVFDEKTANCKLKKKGKNDVLVRLYGTYEYYYVNPVKCSSEFEHVVKEKNSNSIAEFQKALEEDLSRMESAGSAKGNAKSGAPKKKRQKRDGIIVIDLDDDEDNTVSDRKEKDGASKEQTPPTSARQVKVMQRLGLMAPPGSPFCKRITY